MRVTKPRASITASVGYRLPMRARQPSRADCYYLAHVPALARAVEEEPGQVSADHVADPARLPLADHAYAATPTAAGETRRPDQRPVQAAGPHDVFLGLLVGNHGREHAQDDGAV